MKFFKIASVTLPVILLVGASGTGVSLAGSDKPVIKLFKSPTCGCCTKWGDKAKAAGYKIEIIHTENMDAVKKMASVPERLQACHTASVGGYIVEGHVPIEMVDQILKDRPKVKGISVPGMPTGSPGMEYGNEREAFNVISFGGKEPEKVYRAYPAK